MIWAGMIRKTFCCLTRRVFRIMAGPALHAARCLASRRDRGIPVDVVLVHPLKGARTAPAARRRKNGSIRSRNTRATGPATLLLLVRGAVGDDSLNPFATQCFERSESALNGGRIPQALREHDTVFDRQ
jgi:hypothetical protein